MSKVFVAIYDDSAVRILHKFYHETPITVYRTTNVGFVEELSAIGHEPLAVLLEEDIEDLRKGNYKDNSLDPDDILFLQKSLPKWEWTQPS